MNEAKHLHDLKMLHQIAAEQIGNILTATTKAERTTAEETYLIAFNSIIKIIKTASNDTDSTTCLQGSRTHETRKAETEKTYS